jgi:hypothetical protein
MFADRDWRDPEARRLAQSGGPIPSRHRIFVRPLLRAQKTKRSALNGYLARRFHRLRTFQPPLQGGVWRFAAGRQRRCIVVTSGQSSQRRVVRLISTCWCSSAMEDFRQLRLRRISNPLLSRGHADGCRRLSGVIEVERRGCGWRRGWTRNAESPGHAAT